MLAKNPAHKMAAPLFIHLPVFFNTFLPPRKIRFVTHVNFFTPV